MTPDERKAQIEALAAAWEACGDGRKVARETEFWARREWAKDVFNTNGDCEIAYFETVGEHEDQDTTDATPCLALLRDVYGEDVDILHSRKDLTHYWRVRTLEGYDIGAHGASSSVSRLEATVLALEAKEGK